MLANDCVNFNIPVILFLDRSTRREHLYVRFFKRLMRSKWPLQYCMDHFPSWIAFLNHIGTSPFRTVWWQMLSTCIDTEHIRIDKNMVYITSML